ncbi:MAG: cytochrome c3 family protein [Proteobacteria bacterium]|nr:cytochrome c3 family protein [Pseudomonadota bacterium]MBU4295037.1 cytochrome c3 family protein [Pseudomonadota bacterium]MCG2746611.1 cytochrome c3 family protein [Desulfobulbaceae bacterium]
MAKVENDLTTPRITDIKADVQLGILINSVITWQTDKKTNATVHYGIEDMGQIIEKKYCFVTDHKITLPGLKKGSTYQVAITCQDIFGNSSTSPSFSFSTADISPLHALASENQRASSDKIALKNNFFTTNDKNVILELTANQPVSIALGTAADEPAERQILMEKSGQSTDTTKEHIPLTNKKYSSMTICTTCHEGLNQQKSHPVNILPKGKSKIPPEYPTLPDGRISCMTCHINHAANIEYRLIKSSRKELCLGCHPDKF